MNPRFFRVPISLVLFLCATTLWAGDKNKNKNIVYRTEGLVADAAGAAEKVIDARRQCNNYGWAAAAESLLRDQGADISQDTWVVKLFGGDKCMDVDLDFAAMAKQLEGGYALASGRKIQISTDWQPGAPVNVDGLIAGLAQGRLFLLCWKGRAFVLAGMTYDREISARTGNRIYYIREMRLVDPLAAKSDPKRLVKFIRDQDDPNDIAGVMSVSVSERQF